MYIPVATREGYSVGETVTVSFSTKVRQCPITEILPKRVVVRLGATPIIRRVSQISKVQ